MKNRFFAESDATLWSSWSAAAAEPGIDAALRGLYADLDAAVAARGPTCWTSGKCCRFDQYGHRLYVTGLEIAWFLRGVTGSDSADGADDADDAAAAEASATDVEQQTGFILKLPQVAEHPGACPYQVGGLCSTHVMRPLGCRIFFCQRGTEAWQQDLYEQYLQQLRNLHSTHDLEYRYMDWMAALAEATPLFASAVAGADTHIT